MLIFRSPQSAEAVLKLLYTLSANPETSGPILRYLHSSDQFFMSQLQLFPIKSAGSNQSEVMRSQAWLMRASAIHLKNVCQSRLRSQLANWVNLLLSPTRNTVANTSAGGGNFAYSSHTYKSTHITE